MESAIEKNKFQKYAEYKDSRVEWSGLVPKNWGALPIRAIFEERNEKNEGRRTDFILSVTKDRGVIPYDEKGAIGNNKSEDIERYKLVYPNDFVINKMNVVIGSLGMSKYFGAFSQVYLVYKPKSSNININYYSYIFSNPSFYKSLIKYRHNGT
jgi:type I restriction enzyme S subunit